MIAIAVHCSAPYAATPPRPPDDPAITNSVSEPIVIRAAAASEAGTRPRRSQRAMTTSTAQHHVAARIMSSPGPEPIEPAGASITVPVRSRRRAAIGSAPSRSPSNGTASTATHRNRDLWMTAAAGDELSARPSKNRANGMPPPMMPMASRPTRSRPLRRRIAGSVPAPSAIPTSTSPTSPLRTAASGRIVEQLDEASVQVDREPADDRSREGQGDAPADRAWNAHVRCSFVNSC